MIAILDKYKNVLLLASGEHKPKGRRECPVTMLWPQDIRTLYQTVKPSVPTEFIFKEDEDDLNVCIESAIRYQMPYPFMWATIIDSFEALDRMTQDGYRTFDVSKDNLEEWMMNVLLDAIAARLRREFRK